MRPSVLIVNADAFSMGWRGATPRTMDTAAALTRHGWDVSMLTPRLSISVDHSALDIAFPGRILQTPFGGAYISWLDAHDTLRRANRALWKLRGKDRYRRAFQYGWAVRTARWARHVWRTNLPDAIWTISSSSISSAMAGRYLSRVFDRPMIMELRDPLIYPGDDPSPKDIQRGFDRCVRRSSAIVTTTESFADYLRKTYDLPPERVVAIYRAYRGELKSPSPKPNGDDLVLLHAGLLTTSRGENARTLLEALALVFKKVPSAQGHIRIRLVGGGGGTSPFKSLAKKMNLSGSLECVDEVPFDRVKEEMRQADVLLVIKYTGEKYRMQIPGKLFEYLGMGMPILGIMQRSTEAAEILVRSGLGIVPERDEPESLGQSILELWNRRGRLHETYRADADYVKQFSLESMGDRVHGLLGGVVAVVARQGLAEESCPTAQRFGQP